MTELSARQRILDFEAMGVRKASAREKIAAPGRFVAIVARRQMQTELINRRGISLSEHYCNLRKDGPQQHSSGTPVRRSFKEPACSV